MIAAGTLPAGVPQNFGYITDAAQKEAQEKLAHLVSNAKQHNQHEQRPRHYISSSLKLVILIDAIRQIVDAIRQIVDAVRGERQLAR